MTKFRKRFDPFGNDYDYETAIKEGVRPDKTTKHWGSRAPISGQTLKGRKHETWIQHEGSEELMDYELKFDPNKGRYFSFPKGTRNPPTRKK